MLTRDQLLEIIRNGENSGLSGAGFECLDERRLRDYFGRVRQQEVPDTDDGSAWAGLLELTEVMAEGAATVAGMLLFGRDPNRFLPQAGIDALALPGPEKDYAAVERAGLRGPMAPLLTRAGKLAEPGLVGVTGAAGQRGYHRGDAGRGEDDPQPDAQRRDARLRLR